MGCNGMPPGSKREPESFVSKLFSAMISVVFCGMALLFLAGCVLMMFAPSEPPVEVRARIVAVNSNWIGSATTYELPDGERIREGGTWGQVGDEVRLQFIHGRISR